LEKREAASGKVESRSTSPRRRRLQQYKLEFLQEVIGVLKRQGYAGQRIDTIEIASHSDGEWPTFKHELLSLSEADRSCPPLAAMRAGLHHDRECQCLDLTRTAGTVRCQPVELSFGSNSTAAWPGTEEQWQLARHELGVDNADFNAQVRLSPTAISMHHVEHRFGHEFCQAVYNGWLITYVQIYKTNTNGLCANVWSLAKRPRGSQFNSNHPLQGSAVDVPRRKWLTFTVVREPLAHFESGFSEVSWRVKDTSKSRPSVECCQAWWRHGTSAAERAPAFLADYLSGRIFDLWCCPADHDTDLHVLPQVAFLTHAQSFVPGGRLHRILRLESLEADWADLGRSITDWPAFNTTEWRVPWAEYRQTKPHEATNAESSSATRSHMRTLLAEATPRRAICRVLMPDYVCFNYSLPDGCADLHNAHSVDCSPLAFVLSGHGTHADRLHRP